MFGQCRGPIWHKDDFSHCILQDYIQILLPLIACAISVLLILAQTLRRVISDKNQLKHKQLLVNIEEEEDNDNDHESMTDLTLQRSVSRTETTRLELDKPKGEIVLVAIELVTLLGEIALGVVAIFVTGKRGHTEVSKVSIAGLITWGYIAALALARFLLSTARWNARFLKLWNHTVFLYSAQWLFEIVIFRSSLIRPAFRASKILNILEFTFSTVLFLVAMTSRRGNRAVLLEYENDIEPPHEPLASLLSLATFSWADALIWRGYKKPLEIADIWNVGVKDKAAAVLAGFRQHQKTHSLALRLLLHFKKDVLIQGAWAMIESVVMFLPTLLLKIILEYLENPEDTPANAAWLYVILLPVSGILFAVAAGQALWIGRKVCIRLRSIIIGEIYSKALRRKAAATAEAKTETRKDELKTDKRSKKSKRKALSFGRKTKVEDKNESNVSALKAVDTQANNGTIINLMSIDSFKVSEICAYLHFLWATVPVELAMALILLYRILGLSSFVGIGMMILVLPLNFFIAKSFQSAQKRIMAATDARIHSTNEILQNIRIIKYFAWEKRFAAEVDGKRKEEMDALLRRYILWSAASTVWSAVPILITFGSFLVYTVVEKKPLVPSVAFPALSMFSLLRIPLDQLADMVAHVQESKVSVDRIEKFLNEEDTEKYVQLRDSRTAQSVEPGIELENATLTWGTKGDPLDKEVAESFRLINMSVKFEIGELNIIAGPTGSGKTSLLMALLGEMKLLEGKVQIPGGFIRQELRADPQTGLTESVAYCSQQAWLVNDTIKENILFASPFDAKRYKAVIKACALERDLEILDAGDKTLVGEKGITLSGGQKQRVSLARALYCSSKHVFLDDCLSAVDSHTAKHIFEKAILGEMMENRTCILVTHNVTLTVPSAKFVVVLANGKISTQGDPEHVARSGVLGEELAKAGTVSRGPSAPPSRVSSDLEEQKAKLQAESQQDALSKKDDDQLGNRTEGKAQGSVKMATIYMYLRSMGPWWFWVVASFAFVANQVGQVATNVWIRQWSNAYHTSTTDARHAALNVLHQPKALTTGGFTGLTTFRVPQTHASSIATSDGAHAEDVNVAYYLGIYVLIGAVYVMICFVREIVLFAGGLHASKLIHTRLLNAILRAKFKFFDSTPLGQLMNRFSKDIEAIDQEVAPITVGMIHCLASTITSVVLIATVTPAFLIAGIFISMMYFATGYFYIHSSRDLKRLESVQRSPLFQAFGETLSGVVTIRAYGDESRFMSDNHHRVNTHNRPFIYLWATNRWLAFRIDVAGAFVSFFAALFVVINVNNIDAGAAGLSLSYAITFSSNVLWVVRLYAANEQNMNAVERLREYMDVEQEAAAEIPETKPAANWPSHGAVEFIGYSTRYRTDLDQVLKKLTFKINAGEKVGIVGRTGAGKSSLALALFRGLEAEEGQILIDDTNIGLIGLQDLRGGITIVPQDPTLFTGTLRTNLDPFDRFTDEEIFTALRRVHLIPPPRPDGTADEESGLSTPNSEPTFSTASTLRVNGSAAESSSSPSGSENGHLLARAITNSRENKNIFRNLSSPIAESGSNLSQGQRQLLCLARALLKSPRVLVMDEATASIDYATDAKIQETLRELKGNTIVTIAHRLQTIIDYDKVLVLDKGELVEYDDPWTLIKKENGSFRGMCGNERRLGHAFEHG